MIGTLFPVVWGYHYRSSWYCFSRQHTSTVGLHQVPEVDFGQNDDPFLPFPLPRPSHATRGQPQCEPYLHMSLQVFPGRYEILLGRGGLIEARFPIVMKFDDGPVLVMHNVLGTS